MTFFKGGPARACVRSIGLFFRHDGNSPGVDDLENARRERLPLASIDAVTLARLEEGVAYQLVTRT